MQEPIVAPLPHYGYDADETPTYARCPCGQTVRTDRLDLLREHADVCGQARQTPTMTLVRAQPPPE